MKRCRKTSGSSELGNLIYPFQFCAVRGQRIPMKGVAHKKITEIFLSEFDSSVKATMERKKTKVHPRIALVSLLDIIIKAAHSLSLWFPNHIGYERQLIISGLRSKGLLICQYRVQR